MGPARPELFSRISPTERFKSSTPSDGVGLPFSRAVLRSLICERVISWALTSFRPLLYRLLPFLLVRHDFGKILFIGISLFINQRYDITDMIQRRSVFRAASHLESHEDGDRLTKTHMLSKGFFSTLPYYLNSILPPQ